MKIGVLGLQGDFAEHIVMFKALGREAVDVRRPAQLADLDALVIPGGESTTIGKLARQYGLVDAIRDKAAAGMPVWGTCAGAIFMAREVADHPHPVLGLMDLSIERNAFGRQIHSFEADLEVKGLSGAPFHAVFIRAPRITAVGDAVEVLSSLDDGSIVAARQGTLLATSFHPELTGDPRLHELFLRFAEEA